MERKYERTSSLGGHQHLETDRDTATLDSLTARLQQDPGLPVANPTSSYWQQPPHKSISDIQSPSLPDSADVVIIGTGITGCSIARQLLYKSDELHVVMLDARNICSGATGRNGGHVKAVPEISYSALVPVIGKERAQEVVRFTLANVEALLKVGQSLSLELQEYSELRQVNSLTVCTDDTDYERVMAMVKQFDQDNPDLAGRMRLLAKRDMTDEYGIVNSSGGTLASAGAAWPYRLITGILADLLDKHKSTFHIEANAPVEAVKYEECYHVRTPRGTIKAGKVIHATNGHAGYLIPGLRGPLFPIRGQMTTQTSHSALESHSKFGAPGAVYSWSVRYGKGFDYITQSSSTDDLFIGGGLIRSDPFEELGNPRDDANSPVSIAHLGSIMDATFGTPVCRDIKATWTGTMGFTSDGLPFVGQVSQQISGRAGDGEYVAAGYNGYGMANAWLCGKHVADLVLAQPSKQPIPLAYALTQERLAGMDVRGAARQWLDTFDSA